MARISLILGKVIDGSIFDKCHPQKWRHTYDQVGRDGWSRTVKEVGLNGEEVDLNGEMENGDMSKLNFISQPNKLTKQTKLVKLRIFSK